MGVIKKEQIKSYFETGDKPKQQEYWDTWDSYWHKDEILPQERIEQLQQTLSKKTDVVQFEEHLSDTDAHGTQVRTVALQVYKDDDSASDEELVAKAFDRLSDEEKFIKDNEIVIIDANIKVLGSSSNGNI